MVRCPAHGWSTTCVESVRRCSVNAPGGIEILIDPADIEAARRSAGSDEPTNGFTIAVIIRARLAGLFDANMVNRAER